MKNSLLISLSCFFISCFMGSMVKADQKTAEKVSLQQLFGKTIERIAFGSCAKQWQSQPIWDAVIAERPDLWLFLGDAVYADTDGKTAWPVSKEQVAGEWNRLADKPEFQKARAKIPMMAVWDNHDYGSHAGGAEFPIKKESKEVFLNFWGEPKDSPRWKRSGIYDAKIFGPEGKRVQIILLDTKYNRSPFKKNPVPKEEWLKAGKVGGYIPDNDPRKTHLGEEQWKWLEEELKKPAEVRLIASSTQAIPDEKGMDEWGNFPHERQRLFDLIAKIQTNGVVLLSGNVHFAEVSKLEDRSLVEFTSSGMTHVNKRYANAVNKYRIVGPSTDLNFGMVEINWQNQPSPLITLKAINNDGTTVFSHQVSLDEQQSDELTSDQKLIVCTDPRPQLCTMDYRPVCAQLKKGSFKTYSNGCTACSDLLVTAYEEGVCNQR